ncbi:hypothetical protein MIND_00333700 [Mycena indigotica]|uniref:BTB domain-containing protein n=1 Tax=Mycena indigotica TaxID=2126181 RepID=A0A8H6T3K6_9AGAR|nr:uncharacterized protein MIND_00333700 [Mycena indigotica]KAF7309626.1 hypothetical protein MIND_00333700 [Mycena indigotica]
MNTSQMERVDSLWFNDGNIIIEAHGVLFRVYRGLLEARSPVFADLLAFPQPDDSETIDGCQVMHLEDSAADMLYFLKALFDYEFFAPYPAKTDFDSIHGILRLGTKYRVEPLRRRALQHLASAHPTSLAAWDSLCSIPSNSTSSFAPPAYAGPSFDFSNLELPIITLARAAHANWILPTAFFRALATLSSADILDGIDYTSVHVELERADKVLLLEAGSTCLGEPIADILGFLWSPTVIPGCENANSGGPASNGITNACTSSRLMMRVAAERWRSEALALLPICVSIATPKGFATVGDENGDAELSDGMKSETLHTEGSRVGQSDEDQEGRAIWSEEDFSRLSVCGPCLAHMKTDWAARRARFWERLPSLFGLETWEELERQRFEQAGW